MMTSISTISNQECNNQLFEDVIMIEAKQDGSFLPDEIWLKIFSYIKGPEFRNCRLVNPRMYKVLSSDYAVKTIWRRLLNQDANFIGKEKWAQYIGDIGEEPPLPKEFYYAFGSKCPFFPGERVCQTQMLLLIPSAVDNKPFTLKSFGKLVMFPKLGNATGYSDLNGNVVTEHGDKFFEKAHWVFLTKRPIDVMGARKFVKQKAILEKLSDKAKVHYQIPHALYVVTGSFMNYVTTKRRLFSLELQRYTRCLEIVKDNQVIVGGYDEDGLKVHYRDIPRGFCTVAAAGELRDN